MIANPYIASEDAVLELRVAINPPWSQLPSLNALVNDRPGDFHVDRYQTTLTLKSVVNGVAVWRTHHGRYRVDEARFVVLNQGQEYGVDIRSDWETEPLTVFFRPGYVEGVASSMRMSLERMLDETPSETGRGRIEFFERMYPKDGPVGRLLSELHRALHDSAAPPDQDWLEERFLELTAALIAIRDQTSGEIESFPGLRASTRMELYRRLHFARDYIDSCFAERLSVARVARVACLSPFHFQRLFKSAFGVTPMRRLQARRLEEAKRLLATRNMEVSEVCSAIGFESLGSFSTLFRKRFGASPRAYRVQTRVRSCEISSASGGATLVATAEFRRNGRYLSPEIF